MATGNLSGRQMNIYAPTKSDPICKWRTASVETVIQLVSSLPKSKMSKDSFRDHMSRHWNGDFFHTAYQLAAQLALYYEDDVEFIPRFEHDIDIVEANAYMRKWMERYYVPNPFTKRGFINVVPPINLVNALVDYMDNHGTKPNLATAGAALFGGEMGNIGCVKYVLNAYSNILNVDKDNNITVLLPHSGKITVNCKRDDKKAFFENFN